MTLQESSAHGIELNLYFLDEGGGGGRGWETIRFCFTLSTIPSKCYSITRLTNAWMPLINRERSFCYLLENERRVDAPIPASETKSTRRGELMAAYPRVRVVSKRRQRIIFNAWCPCTYVPFIEQTFAEWMSAGMDIRTRTSIELPTGVYSFNKWKRTSFSVYMYRVPVGLPFKNQLKNPFDFRW